MHNTMLIEFLNHAVVMLCHARTTKADKMLYFLAIIFMAILPGTPIGHDYEYPLMHIFRYPRHTQSMIAYMSLIKYFWRL